MPDIVDILSAQLDAAKQRELELLAVIQQIRNMPAPVDPKVSIDWPIFEQWVKVNELCDSALSNPSQALREHEAKVLEKAADYFNEKAHNENFITSLIVQTLHHLAEERRKK